MQSEDEIMKETADILSKYGDISIEGISTRGQLYQKLLNSIKNMEQIIAQLMHEREGLIRMVREGMEK